MRSRKLSFWLPGRSYFKGESAFNKANENPLTVPELQIRLAGVVRHFDGADEFCPP